MVGCKGLQGTRDQLGNRAPVRCTTRSTKRGSWWHKLRRRGMVVTGVGLTRGHGAVQTLNDNRRVRRKAHALWRRCRNGGSGIMVELRERSRPCGQCSLVTQSCGVTCRAMRSRCESIEACSRRRDIHVAWASPGKLPAMHLTRLAALLTASRNRMMHRRSCAVFWEMNFSDTSPV